MTTAAKAVSRRPLPAAPATALLGVICGIALTGVAEPVGIAGPSAAVLVAIALVRALLDGSAVATLGLSLLAVLIGHDRPSITAPALRRARRACVVTSLVWTVSALVTLLLEARERQVTTDALGFSDVVGYVASSTSGKGLALVSVLALVHCGLSVVTSRRAGAIAPEAMVGLALFALLPLPITGHASGSRLHDLTLVSVELHVMAAAAWAGGLGAVTVVLSGHRAVLAAVLPRFSRLATVCIAATAVTGVLNGVVELILPPTSTFWQALFSTPYGLLVIGKLACMTALAVIAARMRWRLLPGIAAHRHTAFAAWATVELAVMGLAIGFAAVLARAPAA